MRTTLGRVLGTLLLVALSILACGGPDAVDLGVPVPALRIAGSDRLAQETWIAHVAVEDDVVRVRVNYDPADGGPRERTLTGHQVPLPEALEGKERGTETPDKGVTYRRVATVIHASPDQVWNRTLRHLPGDDTAWIPRLFVAGRGGTTLPVFVPPHHAESHIARLGPAFQPQDLSRGIPPDAVTRIRITRENGRIRYRWSRADGLKLITDWSGGDRSFTPEEVRRSGWGSLLPDLARFLETRSSFPRSPQAAVVFLDVTEEVQFLDVLRVIECAGGDPEVLFYTDCYHEREWMIGRHQWQIRAPRADRSLTSLYGLPRSGSPRLKQVSLSHCGEPGYCNWVTPPEKIVADLDRYVEKTAPRRPADSRQIMLRFDTRCPWSLARPWVVRCEAAGVGLLLSYQFGDYGLDPETGLALPPLTEAPRLSLTVGAAASRSTEARDHLVRLTAPDSATVGDVWQAVLALMDAGALGIDFE